MPRRRAALAALFAVLSVESLSPAQLVGGDGGSIPRVASKGVLEAVTQESTQPRASGDVTIEDRQFWSFRPLKRPEPPAVKDTSWCRTPIDRFVLHRLEALEVAPNPDVDRRRLIRRVAFTLTGLPPTPDEVERFVRDKSADAFERVVDHFLDSPHFGERWARHWLDLARFAESHGFEHDTDREHAYHYRDFLIKALNDDLPYTTFVKWQIAGDEYKPEEPLAMMATGFLAAGTHATQITKNQVEKERYDELDDMANTVGTAFLGLAVGCARCHDHKFDPIPTSDYYRLLSTFTTTIRSDHLVPIDPKGHALALREYERKRTPLVEALSAYERGELRGAFETWLGSIGQARSSAARRDNDGNGGNDSNREDVPVDAPSDETFGALSVPPWTIVDIIEWSSTGGTEFEKQSDGSLLSRGKFAAYDTFTFVANTEAQGITAVRLDALADDSLVRRGPGRADNGNIGLSDFRVTAAPTGGGDPVPVPLVSAASTFESSAERGVAKAIDDDPRSRWAVAPEYGKDHSAVFTFGEPIGYESGTTLTFTLAFNTNRRHTIGRPRLALTTAREPQLSATSISQRARIALTKVQTVADVQRLLPAERDALFTWWRQHDERWQQLSAAVAAHAATKPEPATTRALVSSEGLRPIRLNTQGDDYFDVTYFLNRGDPRQKGEVATQGFLQVLMRSPNGERHWKEEPPPGSKTSFRRRALAEWLTDVDNGAGHLLARVIVNRLWQHHLGRGIVGTPSDFGSQGERPTHPELLDWLASELIHGGWRLKPLHRLIVLSSVYRQSSQLQPGATEDPQNRLLWRWNPRRLEAEALRDAMLAVSGRLDPLMYGPGSLDEAHRRRSIYFFVKRSKLIPWMMLFDAPDTLGSVATRPVTTVAPQALLLMNHPVVRRCAESFSARLEAAVARSDADGITLAYELALARRPTPMELSDAIEFVEQQTQAYTTKNAAADTGVDAREAEAQRRTVRERAMADFCQVLLGLNEFAYLH